VLVLENERAIVARGQGVTDARSGQKIDALPLGSCTWHAGETVGIRNCRQRFLDHKLTIIVLSNGDDLVAAGLALQVADLFFGQRLEAKSN
jgi:hypothetical protein